MKNKQQIKEIIEQLFKAQYPEDKGTVRSYLLEKVFEGFYRKVMLDKLPFLLKLFTLDKDVIDAICIGDIDITAKKINGEIIMVKNNPTCYEKNILLLVAMGEYLHIRESSQVPVDGLPEDVTIFYNDSRDEGYIASYNVGFIDFNLVDLLPFILEDANMLHKYRELNTHLFTLAMLENAWDGVKFND